MARKKTDTEIMSVDIDTTVKEEDTAEDIQTENDTSLIDIEPIPTPEQKTDWIYNPNEKTYVRNITNIGISVILENTTGRRGEVFIPPKQARPISNEEIMIKYEAQNPSFCGTDGFGANASLYIENEGFRRYLNFEVINEAQSILSDAVLEKIFNTEGLSMFKKLIEKSVKTYAEKDRLVSYLHEKFNSGDFDSASKIDFVEQYTGLKIK